MNTTILAVALAAGTVFAANSATITYQETSNSLNVVTIVGEITQNDSDHFDQVVAPLSGPTVVFLQSPGGVVGDGLNIGLTIRRLGYGTAVADGDICASVCGMIWLAGSPRFLTANSKIGFHAAYRKDGTESGQANALVGAYLSKLGLSYTAIAYLTESPPDDMSWLHPSDASRVGITFSLIKPPKEPEPFVQAPESIPQHQPAPQPRAPIASRVEQQAQRLVLSYYAYWSQGGTNVDALAPYYSNMVSFYGNMISREKVMEEKRTFSARWPIRQYTINPDSLFVICSDNTCTVTGVVAWDCTSQERGMHSVGTANFAVRIVNGAIVSENGSVIKNVAAPPIMAAPTAPVTPAALPSAARIGPSFDCTKADSPVMHLICRDADLSRADVLMVQPYYVLRHLVGPTGWKALMVDAINFQQTTQQACGVDASGNLPSDLGTLKGCLIRAYATQRNVWMARLSGSGLQEAQRPIQQHIALQARLQTLGYLPATEKPDGIYGTTTRAAIINWQQSVGLPITGLLGDGDAARL